MTVLSLPAGTSKPSCTEMTSVAVPTPKVSKIGSLAVVNDSGRKFQQSWTAKYHWINFVKSKVYCTVCQSCNEFGLFTFSTKRDEAFITEGFSNWRNALARFAKHDVSKCHQEAVIKIASREKDANVAGMLVTAHQQERERARDAMYAVITSLHYLCKQGLAIRGHDEAISNFITLLNLRSSDNAALKAWINRSGYKWLSPNVQNELIKDMAHAVLRDLVTEIRNAGKFAIIMDETTDASVSEQVSICFRHVSEKLEVNETFVGLYETVSTNAFTLFNIVDDVMKRFNISLTDCRGQCFDGAANMAGNLSGLQERIKDVEPKAMYVHCLNHSLSLAFQDAVSVVPQCRDAINQIKELINFVRDSPKRLNWFADFQSQDSVSLRPLCPTRWTMRISSIQSVLSNYAELLSFLQDMSETETGEAGYKSSGFAKQLQTFSMYFALQLLNTVFASSECLARRLQSPKLSLSNAKSSVTALAAIWTAQREENRFHEIWTTVVQDAEKNGVDNPTLPRARKVPRRLDPEGANPHVDRSTEDFYRRIYFATIDAALGCLASRFDSEAFNLVCSLESITVDAINARCPKSVDLHPITAHFGDDLNADRFKLHVAMFGDLCRSSERSNQIRIESINDIVQCLQENDAWLIMLPELVNFLRLFLTIPVTSCTAERSFSSLRRLKTYLRSTMSQERLNHIAVLTCHRNKADSIDLKGMLNTFTARNDIRAAAFATFPKQ